MKVYLIYANADMTEGRGPMQLVRVMKGKRNAVLYALEQPGVMGVKGQQIECLEAAKIGLWSYRQLVTKLVKGDWEVYEVEPE